MNKLMMMMAFLLSSFSLHAGDGILKGKILDADLKESLIGVNIYVQGTTTGTVTDFDGNYSLTLSPGKYTIVYSYISYKTVTISDVEIKEDESTVINLDLKTDSEQLETVVIEASVITESEVGLLIEQKKAINLTSGISNQTISKIGDSNLSSAIKRITGVTVEDNKHVYVRGIGDRYTKTTLNGVNIPGLDPDKNSVRLDIFPSSIIDNVTVYKTFTPNLYGDFTGGLVDIETKYFVDQKTTILSLGLSAISGVTFNPDFILYGGSPTDWLGFDNGTRDLPFDKHTEIPSEPRRDPQLEYLTRSFYPEMATKKRIALPGGSFSFTSANKFDRGNKIWGYNAILNYANFNNYYNEFTTNNILKDPDADQFKLFTDESRRGSLGKNVVSWSALGTGSVQINNNFFSLTLLRNQFSESNASARINRNFNQTGATLNQEILTYTQQSQTNIMASGSHKWDKIHLNWKESVNWSRVYDPDFRTTSISTTDGDTSLNVGDGAGITRFYRDLTEFNNNLLVDFIIPINQNKIKFGATHSYKSREFEILSYVFRKKGSESIPLDPDWFFKEENIWTPEERVGTYVIGNFEPTNSYSSKQNIVGSYAMAEWSLTPKLKSIFGVRGEFTNMFYTGQNNTGSVIYNNEKTLEEISILPSLNLIYSLDRVNLRASYNRTLARPSFKEKSIAQIYDPITNRTFIGNIDLLQTNIDNYDLRWEYYITPGELLAVSGFYKTFENHIEMVSFPVDPSSIKPRNAGQSWIYGIELEVIKNLTDNLSTGANVSLIKSFVDMNTVFIDNSSDRTEKEFREKNARTGEEIQDTRPMAGQSPYIVNAYLNYFIPSIDLNFNISYNVQGESLSIIGTGLVPDIYTLPFHSLNLNVIKNHKKSSFKVGVNNILNNDRVDVYRSFGAPDVTAISFNPNVRFSAKYTYTF